VSASLKWVKNNMELMDDRCIGDDENIVKNERI
jgi:hypothetical protein